MKTFISTFANRPQSRNSEDSEISQESELSSPSDLEIENSPMKKLDDSFRFEQESFSSPECESLEISSKEEKILPYQKIIIKSSYKTPQHKGDNFYYFDPKLEPKMLSKEQFMAAKYRILDLKKESQHRRARLQLQRIKMQQKWRQQELKEIQKKIEQEEKKLQEQHNIERIKSRLEQRKIEKENLKKYFKVE